MVTKDRLVHVGFPAEEAARIAALPPVEQVRNLPIIGNAWSDGPLFEAIRLTVSDPDLTTQQKKYAVEQSYRVVGEDLPPLDTDEQIEASIRQYLGDE